MPDPTPPFAQSPAAANPAANAADVFARPGRFMGLPGPEALAGAGAAILGVPFDCGTHATRIGSRLGPAHIREQSANLKPFDPETDLNPLTALGAVDVGDAPVIPGDIAASFPAIERAVAAIQQAGAVPVTMGGDGAMTLPQLRAAARRHPGLCVVHIDAHTDAYPLEGINTATTFTRAAEEGLVDTARSVHIGARGTVMVPGVYAKARALGYGLVTLAALRGRGPAAVFAEVAATVGDRPVYLCFDMDIFDPSVAPGVCTPCWGGLSAAEGLALLDLCAGLNLVHVDVNTVSPPHDSAGMTGFLAGAVILRALTLLIALRQEARAGVG